jgi:hypothetical protein
MVKLETVEIPGLREAIKREQHVRDTAFLDGREILCGIEVVPLSLRRLIWLEQSHNGFVVPWKWEGDAEAFAHAVHLLYVMRPKYSPPESPRESFWRGFKAGWSEAMFARSLRKRDRAALIGELQAWISDAFMDGPKGGGGSEIMPPSYASYPVYLIDLFAEAGLTFTYGEIMEMPLARLWQFWRVASKRVRGMTLTNASDEIAVNHIAGVRA